jgi:hypothetical protein
MRREIGRIIASEVEKYFEVKVNPEAIRNRAKRMGQTDPPLNNAEESATNEELEKNLKKLNHGGAREGSGRKSKAAVFLLSLNKMVKKLR